MSRIKEHIIQTKPRENSGSTASNRFDFQKNWAICKILELHQNPNDYLLTFEYYDDIIVFDSSSDPTKISFFQVKTNKNQNWTINSLISRKKGKLGLLNSHLGKLYDHLEKFDNLVESLNFVTNNKISGKLKNNIKCEDIESFCCNDLENVDLNKIINALKAEHALNNLKNFEGLTYFKLGELSIDKHTELTKAALCDYIDKNLPDVKYQILPLYKSIFDEVRIKCDYENTVQNFEELKLKKSISRNDFDSYIKVLSNSKDFELNRNSIENRLNAETISFDKIKSFVKNSKLYEIKRMSYNDKSIKTIEQKIEQVILDLKIDLSRGLHNCMEDIHSHLPHSINTHSHDTEFIKAIILHKLYE